MQTITVTANYQSDLRTYRWYLGGLREYEAHRDLSPGTPLRFGMVTPSFPMKPLTISKASLEKTSASSSWSLPLQVTEDGWFTIPLSKEADERNADVVVSRRNASNARWVIDIHTPTLPPHIYRLGDLRLECRVYLAIEWDLWKGKMLMARYLSKPLQVAPMDEHCSGPKQVFFNTRPWPRVRAYILREGGRTVRYEQPAGWRISSRPFMLRLHDENGAELPWTNDAQVEFLFFDNSSWAVPPGSENKTHWERKAP